MKTFCNSFFLIALHAIILLTSHTLYSQSPDENTLGDSITQVVEKQLKDTPDFIENEDKIDEFELFSQMDALPAFAVYKDIFFATGIPLNTSINKNTADALFQISFRQRLTKSFLPFNTFLYLTYSQKSFWNIYAESAPFRDNNYNPGINLGRYIVKDKKIRGAAFFGIEHESNGRDSLDNRSWNLITLSTKFFLNDQLSLGFKIWLPFMVSESNKDMYEYKGLGVITANYISKNTRWWFSGELTPRQGWGNINTTVGIGYRVSKVLNEYIFLRFYNGRGESQLEYKKYEMNVRVGICIKPNFYNVY